MPPLLNQFAIERLAVATEPAFSQTTAVDTPSTQSLALIDNSFCITPALLGSSGLQNTFKIYRTQGPLPPKALNPESWLARWEFKSDFEKDPVLDPQTKLLVRDLQVAVTLSLADNLTQLHRLLDPQIDPELLNNLAKLEYQLERSCALALQTLQGIARINSFYRNTALDGQEQCLLLQSADTLVSRAKWFKATLQQAQDGLYYIGEDIESKLSKLEQLVYASITGRLQGSLLALGDLIASRWEQLPVNLVNARIEKEAQLFTKLYQRLAGSGAYRFDVDNSISARFIENEPMQQIVQLAELFNIYGSLLSQERNFDLAAIDIDTQGRVHHRRRIKNCYNDFLQACHGTIKTTAKFGSCLKEKQSVLQCLSEIQDYMEEQDYSSQRLMQRFKRSV